MAADSEREALLARTANLPANGGSVRSVAAALEIGRTAAATSVREARARVEAAEPAAPDRAAAATLAAVAAEESADAVLLDDLARQATDAGDMRTALAIVRERRLLRVERKRSAIRISTPSRRRHRTAREWPDPVASVLVADHSLTG